MAIQEALQKVDFELELPKGWYEHQTPSEDSRFAPLRSLRNPKLLGHVLEKVGKGGRLIVQFDVPKAIEYGLKTGEYVRKGGVIVTSDGHKVVHWLQEGTSIKRIGSAVTILTLLIDLWSEYALNEKLKRIQEQLQRMEGKIDAEYFARFRGAHDSLKNALGAVDEDNRLAWFHKSIERFENARNETFHRLTEIVKKNHEEFVDFHNARVHNTGELLRIYGNLRSIQDHSDRISHCYRAEARIHERLTEFGNAARLRIEALDFLLKACEYLMFFGADGSPKFVSLPKGHLTPSEYWTFFGADGSSYSELGIVKSTGVDTGKVGHYKGGTELHKKLRHIGGAFSYSAVQILRGKNSNAAIESDSWTTVRSAADYLNPAGTAAAKYSAGKLTNPSKRPTEALNQSWRRSKSRFQDTFLN